MHLMIPFASGMAQGCVRALRDLHLPNLSRLLARLRPTLHDAGDEYRLSPPHERALANALGLCGADGCLPWAARQAALDGLDIASHAWGLLTPVHLHLAADHVSLVDPTQLALDETSSRALLSAVRGNFESQGWLVAYGAPLRWYVAHETLLDLPCASIDRVIGRNLDIWLPPDPRASLIRRLQSEVQMLLYHHACNEEREACGAPTVNSFWLSGCGVRQAERASPDLRVDSSLSAPVLAEDWAAWTQAWRTLDAGPIHLLLTKLERDEPAMLTLCGERHALRFEVARRTVWARLTRAWKTIPIAPLLESL